METTLRSVEQFESQEEFVPLVVVEGFLGTAGPFSWHRCLDSMHGNGVLGRRKKIVASLGPVSSLHDRACELYYTLVGGRVDYGEDHSLEHNHARYGRDFPKGLYPSWSVRRPLHFVGHSIGGPTIIKLQHLLNEGHFGESGHADMVLSVSSVCSPFRGTQLVYILGESVSTAPEVLPFSVGSFLSKLVHIVAYLSPLLSSIIDVHADARSLSYRECSMTTFVKQLWKSDWAASKDATPYDMTFIASEDRENHLEGKVYPKTFYRSQVSVMTRCRPSRGNTYAHLPRYSFSFTHNLLYLCSVMIGSFDFIRLHPPPAFSRSDDGPYDSEKESLMIDSESEIRIKVTEVHGEEYWANDGIVPLFSQSHPLPCASTICDHQMTVSLREFEGPIDNQPSHNPLPGRWYVNTVTDTNHLSLYPTVLTENKYQQVFWKELAHWLNAIDSNRNC